jgi:DNA mismatch endonuclease, patch repair protein
MEGGIILSGYDDQPRTGVPMTDFLTPSRRSALMSRVRGKNTRIELAMFEMLQARRIRFSVHADELEGHPDIVLKNPRLVVFVDGDFWHGRNYEAWQHKLQPLWASKIEQNIRRDKRQRSKLRRQGWHVIRLWGSQILKDPERCVERILAFRKRLLDKAKKIGAT